MSEQEQEQVADAVAEPEVSGNFSDTVGAASDSAPVPVTPTRSAAVAEAIAEPPVTPEMPTPVDVSGVPVGVARMRRAALTQAALSAVKMILTREADEEREQRAILARDDVRCPDCDLRYGERDQYGCHESGRAHSYDETELAETMDVARTEPVEFVTVSLAEMGEALGEPL